MKSCRVYLTCLAIFLFCLGANFCIYYLPRPEFEVVTCKIVLSYSLIGAIVIYLLNDYFYLNDINDQFNKVLLFSVLSDLFVILLSYHEIITNTIPMILTLNGLIIAITIIVVINMKRHGLLKN